MKHFLLITLFLWTGAKPTQAQKKSCNSVSATIFSDNGVDITAFDTPSWFSDYCAAVSRVLEPPTVDFRRWPGGLSEYINSNYVYQNYQTVYDSESTYYSAVPFPLSSWSTMCCRLIFDHLTCGDGTELSGQNECVPTNKKDGVVSPANCNILKTAYKSGAGCGC